MVGESLYEDRQDVVLKRIDGLHWFVLREYYPLVPKNISQNTSTD
jgi:hypothetical protein